MTTGHAINHADRHSPAGPDSITDAVTTIVNDMDIAGTPGPPGASTGSANYRFSTTTAAADPGNGKLAANNATGSSVTQLFISAYDDNGVVNVALGSIVSGDTIYIYRPDDLSSWVRYFASGPGVTHGSPVAWVTVPVTYDAQGTSGYSPTNNAQLVLQLPLKGAPGPAGPAGPTGPAGQGVPTGGTTGQVLTKTSATDYATAWQASVGADEVFIGPSDPGTGVGYELWYDSDAPVSGAALPPGGAVNQVLAKGSGTDYDAQWVNQPRTGTSAPASPFAGQLWFDTSTNRLHVYNGTVWVCITPVSARVQNDESSASTTYVDLPTFGPTVTLLTGTTAIVTLSSLMYNTAANQTWMAFAVSGATTLAAADARAMVSSVAAGMSMTISVLVGALTAGLNTFTAKYRVNTGTGTWVGAGQMGRGITVVGVP